jgi:Protein of unknown function (DUF2752)
MQTRSIQILFLAALTFVIGFLYFFNPETIPYPPCIFKKFTGLQCPGCGSARACYHLLHGHLLTAIDYNLLLAGFLPLMALEGISRFFSVNQVLRVIENHIRPIALLCIILVFWVLRNLPFYPFNILSSDH